LRLLAIRRLELLIPDLVKLAFEGIVLGQPFVLFVNRGAFTRLARRSFSEVGLAQGAKKNK